MSIKKLRVNLPFVSIQKCRQIFSNKIYIANEQLCAGGEFLKDTCTGDSGGPLMRFSSSKGVWIIEALVSFGRGCGLEKPGVYTNLRYYQEWLKENMHI